MVTATTRAEMEPHREAWERLTPYAVEPNVWYEPWMLLPAVELLGEGVRFRFAFVYRTDDDSPAAQQELCGVFPFEVTQHSHMIAWTVLRMWRHLLCFLGTPLVHRDNQHETWQAVLSWALSIRPVPSWLELSHQSTRDQTQCSLADTVFDTERIPHETVPFQRACLNRGEPFDDYCQTTLSAHYRQELRRKRRRLNELGRLELRMIDKDANLDEWIKNFLAVEAQGWKREEATALSVCPQQRQFFQRVMHEAFARQRLHMLGFFLNDRPIAMKCNLLAAPGSFAFKIGYDETFAKFSPGVLLECENMCWFQEQQELEWMDSCAKSTNFMINQLWRDRRLLQRHLVSLGVFGNMALFARSILQEWRQRAP